MADSGEPLSRMIASATDEDDECVTPPHLPYDVLRGLVLNRDPFDEDEIREYAERQSRGEKVLHLEKVKTEYVFSRRYDVWDVHMEDGRWWIITFPTNLYPHDLFPSLDYTLSLHIGVTARVLARQRTDATAMEQDRVAVAGAFRRWEQAYDALARADEAEEFQAVGNHCRLALLDLVGDLADSGLTSPRQEQPQRDNFLGWIELIADAFAPGESAQRVRAYLKSVGRDSWQLANWLTHAKNATRADSRLVVDATVNVIQSFASALVRHELGAPDRCRRCGSYRIREIDRADFDGKKGYAVVCEKCGAVAVWRARRRPSGARSTPNSSDRPTAT
jgi:hypothetical protein